ncbi:YoaK family protein [Oxalicibacterium faecigallinarum]|uniref:DUF1275 family protein n=1 Tax=Oxalicibacterium faecigallinarum TaxID=573741 RepID=A0A8J3F3M9_9BURK|nr:YoaK family protein [Oxalicibacterium faecigallinarum]GGI19720.1 DUF1275 family protein [Oxalicibacterium faecigallinarum]
MQSATSNQVDRENGSLLKLNMALGFLAGYVDTVGFMALFGLFTAHITGNLVLVGAELATPDHTFPILKILALPAFVAGVAVAKLIVTACRRKSGNELLLLYVLELLLLVAFMLVGLLASPIQDNMSSMAVLAGIVGAMAMGVHGACGRLLLPHLAPTVMMTGNVTQFVIDFLDLLQHRQNKSLRQQCAKFFWPIIFFGLGAFIAAFAYFRFGFLAMLLPVSVVLILACNEARLERKKRIRPTDMPPSAS